MTDHVARRCGCKWLTVVRKQDIYGDVVWADKMGQTHQRKWRWDLVHENIGAKYKITVLNTVILYFAPMFSPLQQ